MQLYDWPDRGEIIISEGGKFLLIHSRALVYKEFGEEVGHSKLYVYDIANVCRPFNKYNISLQNALRLYLKGKEQQKQKNEQE